MFKRVRNAFLTHGMSVGGGNSTRTFNPSLGGKAKIIRTALDLEFGASIPF